MKGTLMTRKLLMHPLNHPHTQINVSSLTHINEYLVKHVNIFGEKEFEKTVDEWIKNIESSLLQRLFVFKAEYKSLPNAILSTISQTMDLNLITQQEAFIHQEIEFFKTTLSVNNIPLSTKFEDIAYTYDVSTPEGTSLFIRIDQQKQNLLNFVFVDIPDEAEIEPKEKYYYLEVHDEELFLFATDEKEPVISSRSDAHQLEAARWVKKFELHLYSIKA